MKFHETHFEDYISSSLTNNLHPKLESIYKLFPDDLKKLKNVIFYGPSGVGKYTQFLNAIKKYSPSELKYEKKISVSYNKQQYYFKISDIHYEIDMSILGCNSKLLWHEIYQQIIDCISAKIDKSGIIVCKNFHDIHSELLENFYSYMQKNNTIRINMVFIIITEHMSFLPDNIINCCELISIPRPSKSQYRNCTLHSKKKMDSITEITNIKHLYIDVSHNNNYKIISNKLLNLIVNTNDFKFMTLRELLYDILIYNLDISQCIWYIFSSLIREEKIPNTKISQVLVKTQSFFKYYNNNYRPIYHMELYFIYLISIIHEIE